MIKSLALIFLIGLSMAWICKVIKLPRIIGMLVTGIILGGACLDLIDTSIITRELSLELRQIALIIILIKAGLSLNLSDLKKAGRPAILLSFLPATFEMLAFWLIGPLLLPITGLEGLLMGAVLGAVSPAVVIPRMTKLIDEGYGRDKALPEMIIAGSSVDDIFVMVLFYAFLGMLKSGTLDAMSFLNIPTSIILGVMLGIMVGIVLVKFFESFYIAGHHIRNSMKVIIILGYAFLLMAVEESLDGVVAISGLLAIITMAAVIAMKSIPYVTGRLSAKFGKLWLAAEVILFVLVGADVQVDSLVSAGAGAVAMIFIGLAFRSVGTFLCLIKTKLNIKERLYTIIAYIPKATVQAAIGSVPLAAGLACGEIVLTVAVLSILITAPLGAILMDATYKKLLTKC